MSGSGDAPVFALLLDGRGGARELAPDEVEGWQPGDGLLWLHLDHGASYSARYLDAHGGLDPVSREAFTAGETRPRCLVAGEGLLLILRGVNLNPGAEPEDMVSLRGWFEAGRVLTLRRRRIRAAQDLREDLLAGRGARDAAGLLVALCNRLGDRIGEVLEQLDDAVDALQDEVLTAESRTLRARLGDLRRQAIALRRYLAPQRDTLARLQGERIPWLDELDRQRLRESGDRMTRFVEDLDSARERAAVTSDELDTRLADQMNRTMYVLSIVAALFLPLGFLTGLLGINVAGIPGTEDPAAFTIVCVVMLAIAAGLGLFFRWKKWI